MNKTVSLHVKVDEKLAADVTADAKRFKKTKDGIVEAALRQMFCLKPEYRADFYKYLPRKILGRPL